MTNQNLSVSEDIRQRDQRIAQFQNTLLRPLGVPGVYARTGEFEEVIERLAAVISTMREPGMEVLRFPPVMSRSHLERSGYLKSFPNLLGCVCALHGTESEIRAAAARVDRGEDWTTATTSADLVLSPAACYPVYPLIAERGPLPADGARFDVACDCFRHEPSPHPDRLQSFRMREYVCVGSAEAVTAFGARFRTKAQDLAQALGLGFEVAPASDPFFGRVGQVMAISQLQQSLKFELLAPLPSAATLTACMSFNYHRDHFGGTWNIKGPDGQAAHSGCVAFGMDRLATGLFWKHGLQVGQWPAAVRAHLGL